jgi:hypothetical protein
MLEDDDEHQRRSRVLVFDEAVGKRVAPTGTPGETDVAAPQCQRSPGGTCVDASRATSAHFLTGVENGSEAVARGFPTASDELRNDGA